MRTLEKTACTFLPKYIAFLLDEMDLTGSNKIDDGAKVCCSISRDLREWRILGEN